MGCVTTVRIQLPVARCPPLAAMRLSGRRPGPGLGWVQTTCPEVPCPQTLRLPFYYFRTSVPASARQSLGLSGQACIQQRPPPPSAVRLGWCQYRPTDLQGYPISFRETAAIGHLHPRVAFPQEPRQASIPYPCTVYTLPTDPESH